MIKNKKITTRMAGGLGNQIFQLAYSIYLAKKHDINTIYLDSSSLSSYKAKHVNHLDQFFNLEKINFNIEFKNNFLTKLRLPRFFDFSFKKWFLISDRNKDFVENLYSCNFLDGYFIWALKQLDFDEIRLILKNALLEKNTKLNLDDECVIHIRGGDFVELGWDKFIPNDYYIKAMNVMFQKYNVKNFLIITDDLDYATNLMNNVKFDYKIQNNDMQTDFHTIANAKKKIIGGSFFAIWASALGYCKEDGVLIAPYKEAKLPNQRGIYDE